MRKNLAVRALGFIGALMADNYLKQAIVDVSESETKKLNSYRPTPTFFGSGVSPRLFGERVYSRQMKIHAKRRNKVAFG